MHCRQRKQHVPSQVALQQSSVVSLGMWGGSDFEHLHPGFKLLELRCAYAFLRGCVSSSVTWEWQSFS